MATLKLRAIGNSVGLVLPKELLTRLNLTEGDILHAIETPEGLMLTT
jgi:putative addiction module antidote